MKNINSFEDSPLGKNQGYSSEYNPKLLYPIPRAQARIELGITKTLPFHGVDVWTAYELSWLNMNGKPVVAIATIEMPCDSEFIIESKSLKLYLNSFNQTKFETQQHIIQVITKDLSAIAAANVTVTLQEASVWPTVNNDVTQYQCIDGLDIKIDQYQPNAHLLNTNTSNATTEQLVSHLLKSNCPVTGQPDWASLYINYYGPKIDHIGLLSYLISFRKHQGFHEACVEQIFTDIMRECKPEQLTIAARYLRRGGLDINPLRSTQLNYKIAPRTARQ